MKEFNKPLYNVTHSVVFYNLLQDLDTLVLNTWGTKIYNSYTIKLKRFKKQINFKTSIKTEILRSVSDNSSSTYKDFNSTTGLVPFVTFDSYYLKKEKLYTKLKYSRSPQYDIVSGGVAALFSAFIGFLISEKFGIELVDSGDFYTLFMYGVFITFSLRPLIKIVNKFDKVTPIISLLPFIELLRTLGYFFVNKMKTYLSWVYTLIRNYL